MNENSINKSILYYFEEYSKIIKIYTKFQNLFNQNDQNYLNPKVNNLSFKTLFEFLDGFDISKENNLLIICKFINLVDNISIKYASEAENQLIKEDVDKIKHLLKSSRQSCVNLIHSSICKQTNFNEENLNKISSYDQMINLIEFILDKSI